MYGIVDTRYSENEIIGLLRGKSFTLEKALKKSRDISNKLQDFNDELIVSDLEIVKLVGKVSLGKLVTVDQITGIPVVRNTTTSEGKKFWDSVDECAKKAESLSLTKKNCPVLKQAIENGKRE